MNRLSEPTAGEDTAVVLGAIGFGLAAGCMALGLIFQVIGILTR